MEDAAVDLLVESSSVAERQLLEEQIADSSSRVLRVKSTATILRAASNNDYPLSRRHGQPYNRAEGWLKITGGAAYGAN